MDSVQQPWRELGGDLGFRVGGTEIWGSGFSLVGRDGGAADCIKSLPLAEFFSECQV